MEGCYECTISVAGKAQSLFQFSLNLSKESLQKVLLSCQSCAPRILDELSKPKALQTFLHAAAALQGGVGAVPVPPVGSSREILQGHCNILVPVGSVYFLLISESEKSHNAVKNVGTQLLIISISSWTLNLMQPKVSEANTYFILGCFQIEDH